jgi:hypothetical protein
MMKNWKKYLIKATKTALLVGLIQSCSRQDVSAQCVPANFPSDWLQTQEKLGGHTIERHVGKTDQELVIRLNNEIRIRASSSYFDLKIANNQIQTALTNNRQMVNEWAKNAATGQSKVVDYHANINVGRVAIRPASLTNIHNSSRLRIVLRATAEGNCYLLTSYPAE